MAAQHKRAEKKRKRKYTWFFLKRTHCYYFPNDKLCSALRVRNKVVSSCSCADTKSAFKKREREISALLSSDRFIVNSAFLRKCALVITTVVDFFRTWPKKKNGEWQTFSWNFHGRESLTFKSIFFTEVFPSYSFLSSSTISVIVHITSVSRNFREELRNCWWNVASVLACYKWMSFTGWRYFKLGESLFVCIFGRPDYIYIVSCTERRWISIT